MCVPVPQTSEWLHVPPIQTRLTEDHRKWSWPRHKLRIVSQLDSHQLHVRSQGWLEVPPRWQCEWWPLVGSWTQLICRVQWAWPPTNQVYFPRSMSQLSLVPYTSTVHGKWIVMDNGWQVGWQLLEPERSKHPTEVDWQSSHWVVTSDATLRRLICMCTLVDCSWIYDHSKNWHIVMRPWLKSALTSRRWEISCNNFTWGRHQSKRRDDDNPQSLYQYLHTWGMRWPPNGIHLRHPWRHLVGGPKGSCIVGQRRHFHLDRRWTTSSASWATYIQWRANSVFEAGNGVSIWQAALHWRPCGISGRS